jgi:hypothetical protein
MRCVAHQVRQYGRTGSGLVWIDLRLHGASNGRAVADRWAAARQTEAAHG